MVAGLIHVDKLLGVRVLRIEEHVDLRQGLKSSEHHTLPPLPLLPPLPPLLPLPPPTCKRPMSSNRRLLVAFSATTRVRPSCRSKTSCTGAA